MTSERALAPSPETSDRRKRLGQYFSGVPLAALLAALARPELARSIVDPMAGSGDMLVGCLQVGATPKRLAAVDVDWNAVVMCRDRLANTHAEVVHGSAFDSETWIGMEPRWDLVITNPPYVRYQAGGSARQAHPDIPDFETVRHDLHQVVSSIEGLTEPERDVFTSCVASYSGLADLAVPSWLLCAALVKEGGRLAMVVPATWMSRDYAAPVLYVLQRLFEIEMVVNDSDRVWFDDALVRTNLIVARRIADRGTGLAQGQGYLAVELPASAGNGGSLVGQLFDAESRAEVRFADWLHERLRTRSGGQLGAASATWSTGSDISRMVQAVGNSKSIMKVEPRPAQRARLQVPEGMMWVLSRPPSNLVSLEDIGWAVGQGLRTGANDFFYVSRDEGGGYRSALLPEEVLTLPESVATPAIRNQGDLPKDEWRHVTRSQSSVLKLDDWFLPEDAPNGLIRIGAVMEGDLMRLTRAGAAKKYSRQGVDIGLPELSAVRTNVRKDPDSPRCWYHLPPLKGRHRPALFLPRVNNGLVDTFHNGDPQMVVDANFSTLWPAVQGALPSLALLTLMSSSWTRSLLELTATVMGGGALKVEATHLRRLPFPKLDPTAVEDLIHLGQRLLREPFGSSTQDAIDDLVAQIVQPVLRPSEVVALSALARQMCTERSR